MTFAYHTQISPSLFWFHSGLLVYAEACRIKIVFFFVLFLRSFFSNVFLAYYIPPLPPPPAREKKWIIIATEANTKVEFRNRSFRAIIEQVIPVFTLKNNNISTKKFFDEQTK